MAEQDTPSPGVDLYRVARIVGSYVQHHQIGSDQLAGLIGEVHRALASLGRAPPVQEPLMPAVPIRRSVQQDHVVCLECGYRAQVLRRHLRVAHDLEVADYRTRWKLPPDHPVTAPSYSARRSTMAKQLGLGRKPSTVDASPPAAEQVPLAESEDLLPPWQHPRRCRSGAAVGRELCRRHSLQSGRHVEALVTGAPEQVPAMIEARRRGAIGAHLTEVRTAPSEDNLDLTGSADRATLKPAEKVLCPLLIVVGAGDC